MNRRYRNVLPALGILLLSVSSVVQPQELRFRLNLPPRRADAPSGSQLRDLLSPLPVEEREQRIWLEVVQGNVPSFLRTLVPIPLHAKTGETEISAVVTVTPDYFAFGSDTDFFRMPMTPRLAQWLCDYVDCSLPTPKLVDEIWANAEARLEPEPIPPSPDMGTIEVFYRHHLMVETQRMAKQLALGLLTAGSKKDVVLTPQLWKRRPPPRVAIYGWHFSNGSPIQPLSLVHKASYADYSHGIRLVANDMLLNGNPARLPEVLRSPLAGTLLSDEGHFDVPPRYPVEEQASTIYIADKELLP